MGEQTAIQWADHTFNPWRGCTKVSPGCDHCYAEAWSKRNPAQLGVWGDDGSRVIAADAYWRAPLRWDRLAAEAGERHRVFCASLADVFEDRPELERPRERVFETILATPNLDWLLLTKRPELARQVLSSDAWLDALIDEHWLDDEVGPRASWPLPNVWLGVSAEDQARADERIPILLDTPAAVRFVSYEPALSPVDFTPWLNRPARVDEVLPRVDWVIVGGESGPHARPFDIQWGCVAVDECRKAGVPVFVKQMGAQPIHAPEHDGATGYAIELSDRKGGDPDEWPEGLRVREIPAVVAA